MPEESRRLIVGLGNPGPEYATHRHNIGFMVADSLVDPEKVKGLGGWGATRWALFMSSDPIEGAYHVLLKPTTFMNSSGEAVFQFHERLDIPVEDIIVIHDDMDLPLGTIRVKVGGGDGGHRGIRSVADELGTKDFTRVRLGIGRPPEGVKVLDFVLSSFLPEEENTVKELIQDGKTAVNLIIQGGVKLAQNELNRIRVRREGDV